MNVLSLFSGIGGLDLGLERAGMTVVGQIEIDPFCQRVLAKHWPEVPQHDDVRTAVDWWQSQPRPTIDLIAGGFPCQPVSLAGHRLGDADERWLWPAFFDVVRLLRPRLVLLENVPGIAAGWAGCVLGDLAEIGYDAEWDCVPASALGAPHQRDRWWCVAHTDIGAMESWRGRRGATEAGELADADRGGWDRRAGDSGTRRRTEPAHRGGDVADSHSSRRELWEGLGRTWPTPVRDGWWTVEPDVGRVAHGISGRVERLRALGNSVVPQVAQHIGELLIASCASSERHEAV